MNTVERKVLVEMLVSPLQLEMMFDQRRKQQPSIVIASPLSSSESPSPTLPLRLSELPTLEPRRPAF